jgi:alpha-tubulin suppressor-like RCC1 family protein
MRKFYFIIQFLFAVVFIQTAQAQDSWLKVEAGTEFSVALKSDSTLWSWGRKHNVQLACIINRQKQ